MARSIRQDSLTTKQEGLGYGHRVKPLSPAELNSQVRFEDNTLGETLQRYRPYFLHVNIDGTLYLGLYQGFTTDGWHVIRPSVFPRGEHYFDPVPGMKDKEKYEWLDWPCFAQGTIKAFRPVKRSLLESAGIGFDRVEGLGKVFQGQRRKTLKPI